MSHHRIKFVIKDPSDPFYGCTIPMRFEEYGARRRAALHLLPNIEDPENKKKIQISKLKSSRKYKIDEENQTASLEGGYRLGRCSRAFRPKGKWYWEFVFLAAEEPDSHVRFGIATCSADMEAPVGVDEEGYCVRDLGGAFHCSRKLKQEDYPSGTKPFPGFKVGDIIGFGFTHAETAEGTTLEVWINNTYCGVIFRNIDPKKQWIPSFSCYHNAKIGARFAEFAYERGPEWQPADSLPEEKRREKYTLNQMLEMMRNGTISLRTKEMFAATDAVLTPVHEMPI